MPAKLKEVHVSRLEDDDDLYGVMNELIANHHPHLADCKILLARNDGWKPDIDGQVRLGKVTKCSDLYREFGAPEWIIELNLYVMNSEGWPLKQKAARLDHYLAHIEPALEDGTEGEPGEQKQDERGRPIWRTRKPGEGEFREIIERHGLYHPQLKELAESIEQVSEVAA